MRIDLMQYVDSIRFCQSITVKNLFFIKLTQNWKFCGKQYALWNNLDEKLERKLTSVSFRILSTEYRWKYWKWIIPQMFYDTFNKLLGLHFNKLFEMYKNANFDKLV